MPSRSPKSRPAAGAAVAALAVGVLALAGCTSSGKSGNASSGAPSHSPSPSTSGAPASDPLAQTGFIREDTGTAQTGGTLNAVSAVDAPSGYDPVKGVLDGLTGMSEYAAIYDLLLSYDPVAQEFVPQLAESMEPNAAGNEWTIKLRPDVQFSDGTPLDAAAVKYNLDRWGGDDSIGYYYPTVGEIKSVTVSDPLTVVIHLNTVDRELNWIFTQGFGLIGSPTAIKNMGEAKFNLHPVGAGPFMVSKFTPGSELSLVRNPNYWGGDVPLDGIKFTYATGDETLLQSLQNGDLNLINIQAPPTIKKGVDAGLSGFVWLRTEGSTVVMNERKGHVTSDVNVRKAIALAIDPAVINERVYNGVGLPTSSLFPADMYGTTVEGLTPDMNQAKQLVAAAKTEHNWDGSLEMLCKPSPEAQQLCLTEQAMLNAAGFKITVKPAASTDAWVEALYIKGEYDISTTSNQVTGKVGLWTQLTQEFTGPYTPTGYNDPRMADALNALRTVSTDAELVTTLDKIQTVYNETVPEVVVATGRNALLWQGIGGIIPSSNGTVLFNKAYLTS
ncbi:MAG: peptide/nickel transport system substrate-binding protein [Pseudonocardiales bacterium]|nr:peptide/nickel transport system substrate-binding protein [Pseudonocardiales bacterium]